MIHDETTTEFELPLLKAPEKEGDNIVRVKFTGKRKDPIKKANKHRDTVPTKQRDTLSILNRLKEVELSSPWLLRLLAVLVILVLSLLVL